MSFTVVGDGSLGSIRVATSIRITREHVAAYLAANTHERKEGKK